MTRLILGLFFMASAASAQSVIECDWRASEDYIPEPRSENIRSFANGNVEITHLITEEPASYIMVTMQHAEKGKVCYIIGDEHTEEMTIQGFESINFSGMGPSYHPSYGLLIAMDIQSSNVSDYPPATLLDVLINQGLGTVEAFLGGS